MAIIPLDDWTAIIQADPILDAQECNDLRESMDAGVFDDVKMNKIFRACDHIDFVNSHSDSWKIFITMVKNYLFDDDPPDPEPDDYVWDVISKQKGDFIEREIDKIDNFPADLITATFQAIKDHPPGGNNSNKLQARLDALP